MSLDRDWDAVIVKVAVDDNVRAWLADWVRVWEAVCEIDCDWLGEYEADDVPDEVTENVYAKDMDWVEVSACDSVPLPVDVIEGVNEADVDAVNDWLRDLLWEEVGVWLWLGDEVCDEVAEELCEGEGEQVILKPSSSMPRQGDRKNQGPPELLDWYIAMGVAKKPDGAEAESAASVFTLWTLTLTAGRTIVATSAKLVPISAVSTVHVAPSWTET
jgi:hypothetical protein